MFPAFPADSETGSKSEGQAADSADGGALQYDSSTFALLRLSYTKNRFIWLVIGGIMLLGLVTNLLQGSRPAPAAERTRYPTVTTPAPPERTSYPSSLQARAIAMARERGVIVTEGEAKDAIARCRRMVTRYGQTESDFKTYIAAYMTLRCSADPDVNGHTDAIEGLEILVSKLYSGAR